MGKVSESVDTGTQPLPSAHHNCHHIFPARFCHLLCLRDGLLQVIQKLWSPLPARQWDTGTPFGGPRGGGPLPPRPSSQVPRERRDSQISGCVVLFLLIHPTRLRWRSGLPGPIYASPSMEKRGNCCCGSAWARESTVNFRSSEGCLFCCGRSKDEVESISAGKMKWFLRQWLRNLFFVLRVPESAVRDKGEKRQGGRQRLAGLVGWQKKNYPAEAKERAAT